MSRPFPTLCSACKNLRKDGRCIAFPQGIPDNILLYGADHRKKVPGQSGDAVFSLDPDEQVNYDAWRSVQR